MAQQHEGQDLTGISWVDLAWISQFPLNRDTVLAYFSNSPFYEKTCNNEVLKMQKLNADTIKDMRGIEYALVPAIGEPNVFVIRKQLRESRQKVLPIATYYIIDGVVYQAPNIYNNLSSRMMKSIYYMQDALHKIANHLTFSPSSGYMWDFQAESLTQMPQSLQTPEEHANIMLFDSTLANLTRQHPIHKPTDTTHSQPLSPTVQPAEAIIDKPPQTPILPATKTPIPTIKLPVAAATVTPIPLPSTIATVKSQIPTIVPPSPVIPQKIGTVARPGQVPNVGPQTLVSPPIASKSGHTMQIQQTQGPFPQVLPSTTGIPFTIQQTNTAPLPSTTNTKKRNTSITIKPPVANTQFTVQPPNTTVITQIQSEPTTPATKKRKTKK